MVGIDDTRSNPAHPDVRIDQDALWAFAELGRIQLGDRSMETALSRVTELTKTVLQGVSDVSVTLIRNGTATTAAQTAPRALRLDEAQYDSGRGPCLDAAGTTSVHLVDDTSAETQWPEFTTACLAEGIQSSLSVGLTLGDGVSGALNIYSEVARVFSDDAVERAQAFASYAGVTLTNASLYTASAQLAEQLTQAMASRAVIEQAKGILIAQRGVTPDRAFEILSGASQSANRKLRDIAQAMVDGAVTERG